MTVRGKEPARQTHEFGATLALARQGDAHSAASLAPILYTQLRRIAASYLKGEAQVSLQPTALVHEAFLRLCDAETPFADRSHFVAVAATAMRHILIDHHRRGGAAKRGGQALRVTFDDATLIGKTGAGAVDLLAIDQALTRLAAVNPRQARVIELQFFGGMSVEEIGEVVGSSASLVEKELRRARAWIRRELGEGEASGEPGAA